MLATKKNQYALRAIFELARHYGNDPRKISEIAHAQAIPVRFLEVILSKLKGSGFVKSKRGYYGGYILVRSPDEITVGDIMRYMQRGRNSIQCVALVPENNCPFQGDCAFAPMWNEVRESIFYVYDSYSIQDLLDNEAGMERYPL